GAQHKRWSVVVVARHDMVGKPVREALPELTGQGIYELLDEVYETGQPRVARARPAVLGREPGQPPTEHFFDVVYQPLRDATGEIDGIAAVAFEVSELARGRAEGEAASRAHEQV